MSTPFMAVAFATPSAQSCPKCSTVGPSCTYGKDYQGTTPTGEALALVCGFCSYGSGKEWLMLVATPGLQQAQPPA